MSIPCHCDIFHAILLILILYRSYFDIAQFHIVDIANGHIYLFLLLPYHREWLVVLSCQLLKATN